MVLAAAMWNSPHMLVLDEPTNYLDRVSLGALAAAIKTYGGGVVMISHHSGERLPSIFSRPFCNLLQLCVIHFFGSLALCPCNPQLHWHCLCCWILFQLPAFDC